MAVPGFLRGGRRSEDGIWDEREEGRLAERGWREHLTGAEGKWEGAFEGGL